MKISALMDFFFKLILLLTLVSLLAACERIALVFTPTKKPKASTSELAKHAQEQFWNTLHSGNYNNIEEVDKVLTAAYLENPNDPLLAAHLGFFAYLENYGTQS